MTRRRPSLVRALRLRCAYCGETPLRAPRSWIQLRRGCEACGYLYEREEGYFTGAAWVVSYLFAGGVGLGIGVYVVWKWPQLGLLESALWPAAAAGVVAFTTMPYGKALWMYADHLLHPLEAGDRENAARRLAAEEGR